MNKPQFTRPEGTGGKSVLGSDNVTPLNELEKNALGNLDEDKLTELAKCLFTLNNRRCLLYTSPSPRDKRQSRMPSSA